MTDGPVLVTGGAGFIGSHTCLELLEHDHDVVVIDDFSNSSPKALEAVASITDRKFVHYALDVCDRDSVTELFETHRFDSVIHFAARKAPRESVGIPVEYYSTNLIATINLLQAMQQFGVGKMVFSSSCSIYGDAASVPIGEDAPRRPTNPYARSKSMCEDILADAALCHPEWSILALRYFNPTGAHDSGDLGEDPSGVPVNIMPYIAQVAVGQLDRLEVYGGDYPTPDGSGIRDYVHVMDLADAHRVALANLNHRSGYGAYNIGTGVGTSVLELVATFESVSGCVVPYEIVPRRPGDVAELVASPDRAAVELGWSSRRDVVSMCRDAWAFRSRHPRGLAYSN